MTDLTEQDICIGSLGQQKVYLNWSDVKDICVNEVSAAYEQTKRENTKLKELLKECREFFYENLIDTEFHFSCGLGSNIKKQSCIRSLSNLKTKINQALGEDK